MSNHSSQKAFTLIELLVVISIVALLSSVVIAALNSARAKSADATVKASMKQLRNQGPQYRDTNPNFGVSVANCVTASTFFTDAQVTKIRTYITSNIPTTATMSCSTDSTGYKWALSVSALKSSGTSWCIDNNQGWFKAGTATGGMCI
jgi:prepilin-type N-terminal cleavage/methylation domain-containing protein